MGGGPVHRARAPTARRAENSVRNAARRKGCRRSADRPASTCRYAQTWIEPATCQIFLSGINLMTIVADSGAAVCRRGGGGRNVQFRRDRRRVTEGWGGKGGG